MTDVDEYWNIRPIRNNHTLQSLGGIKNGQYTIRNSKGDSLSFSAFPKILKVLSYNVYEQINNKECVLDYGCGTADTIIDVLDNTQNVTKAIGIDISEPALELAELKLKLHKMRNRVELIRVSDSTPIIPLKDESVDFLYSLGVVHHTSYPNEILREFHRVSKGKCLIVVYNKDSTMYHYKWARISAENGIDIDDVCRDYSDRGAPIGKAYTIEEFTGMCKIAGFTRVEYLGGYWGKNIVIAPNKGEREKFFNDDRIDDEHKQFIKDVDFSGKHPTYKGRICGYMSTYLMEK